MNVAVIGSRGFNDYDRVVKVLDAINEKVSISKIVSGGAIGADSLGELYANENEIETLIFKPDWAKFGKGAGLIRNKDIVDNSDIVVAFWDGISKGTKNSIDYATKKCKKVIVINV